MRITTENGDHYDLPADFSIDFELINPMLDTVGSQSAPVSLPATDKNMKILDFPRIDRAQKYVRKRNVSIQSGAFAKQGTQVVFSADPESNIVTTFYFDEAIFYEKVNDITLKAIFEGKSESWSNDFIFGAWVLACLGGQYSEYRMFPVYTNYTEDSVTESPLVLNQMDAASTSTTDTIILYRKTTVNVNGELVTVPDFYGITPFLRLEYILSTIASYGGYTLNATLFRDDLSFRDLCLLNNVADACVARTLKHADLVPDCSINEFIEVLWLKFGMKLVCDEIHKTVTPILMDDILSASVDDDLSSYITSLPQMEWEERKDALILRHSTSFERTAPVNEFYDQFMANYGASSIYQDTMSRYVFTATNGKKTYYHPFFAYRTGQSNNNIEEITQKDIAVGMMQLWQKYTDTPDNINRKDYYIPAPYIGKVQHVKTRLQNAEENTQSDQSTMSIMFAFTNQDRYTYRNCTFHTGSTDKGSWGDFSLPLCAGFKERFWIKYEEFICHSNYVMTCSLRIPMHRLLMMKLHSPKLLNGQPVLIERLKCKIKDGECEVTEATFRTLRKYED